jgi:hypothetical protein
MATGTRRFPISCPSTNKELSASGPESQDRRFEPRSTSSWIKISAPSGAIGKGKKDGKPIQLLIDIFDKQCEDTGFTSMERLTGFSMAIFAHALAKGEVPLGAIRYENAMTGTKFCEEIQRRGVELKFSEA